MAILSFKKVIFLGSCVVDSACGLDGSLWDCRPVISMMFLNLDLVSFTFNVNETKLRMNETLLGNRLRKLD